MSTKAIERNGRAELPRRRATGLQELAPPLERGHLAESP